MSLNQETNTFIFDKKINPWLRSLIFFCMYFLSVWYYFLLLLARCKTNNITKKYYFSICAIFKNESLSLLEWIEYHRIIGVDHIYLYNNFSNDNYYEILKPFIDSGFVTLTEWPVPPPSQAKAYNHFYNNFSQETKWIAFIDLDEYICPKFEDNIKDWIKKYDNFHSLIVYWKQFGSSGLIEHDKSRLIIEQYTISWDKFYDIGKPIFNTDFQVNILNDKTIHAIDAKVMIFNMTFIIPPINEFKKFVKFRCNRIGLFHSKKDFSIQINHYVTKSYTEFFEKKKQRGTATSTGARSAHIRSEYAYNFVQRYSYVADYSIYRFIINLKLKLNKK